MKNLLFTVFFFAGTFCFADQNANQDVKIINGKDYFDTSSHQQIPSGEIKNIDGKQFQVYHVEKGDNWYAIARKFDIPYALLRSANKEIGDKLSLGNQIFIPVNNFQTSNPVIQKKINDSPKTSSFANTEANFHIVIQSQTLFSISRMYGKSVDQIKKWNNLPSNSISIGQKLIVSNKGFNENNSVQGNVIPKTTITSKVEEIQPSVNMSQNKISEDAKKESAKDVKENDTNISSENKLSEINKASDEKIVFAKGRYEVKENGLATFMVEDDSNSNKFYALHRTAPVGTIVRVLNTTNSKKIFVKVIGTLPETKENEGSLIKISKASADKLDVSEKSFPADLLYGINK